jgi:hypothetical protein
MRPRAIARSLDTPMLRTNLGQGLMTNLNRGAVVRWTNLGRTSTPVRSCERQTCGVGTLGRIGHNPRVPRFLVAIVLVVAACGSAPKPSQPPDVAPDVLTPPPPVKPIVQPRQDFTVGESPMSMVVSSSSILWTDSTGAIWSMPKDGGEPKQLSDQKSPNFAFRLFMAGDQVLATSRKDLLRIAGSDGPVTMAGLGLADNPEEATGSTRFAYLTVFKRNEILRVPVRGGVAEKLGNLPRGVLGAYEDTLYAVSYSTGVLVAFVDGAAARPIAKGFDRPTAVAADATHVFVYSERAKTITRVELATSDQTVIARDLENSDDMVSDGPWIYAFTWGKHPALLRIAKDGSRPPQVIADDLKSPYRIAVDADAIYVTSRDQNKIVKLLKSALPAP